MSTTKFIEWNTETVAAKIDDTYIRINFKKCKGLYKSFGSVIYFEHKEGSNTCRELLDSNSTHTCNYLDCVVLGCAFIIGEILYALGRIHTVPLPPTGVISLWEAENGAVNELTANPTHVALCQHFLYRNNLSGLGSRKFSLCMHVWAVVYLFVWNLTAAPHTRHIHTATWEGTEDWLYEYMRLSAGSFALCITSANKWCPQLVFKIV